MSAPSAIVIQFPGSNCEYETQRALDFVGFDVDIVRWNDPLDVLMTADLIVLPGGFSFQDRVRAGAISAKLPILERVRQASEQGVFVMGICNGCQILVEAGLVPQLSDDVACAMQHNRSNDVGLDYLCEWVYVKVKHPQNSPFTNWMSPDDVFPVQMAHAEGCFEFSDRISESDIKALSHFVYCDSEGQELSHFPVNPNGSDYNIAGLLNPQGNVFAFMPHPERGVFLHQMPLSLRTSWSLNKYNSSQAVTEGPWLKMFESLKTHVSMKEQVSR